MSYVSPGAGALVAVHPGQRANRSFAPVYQIDFTAVASGKRIASTKRRVRWRFGFANQDALAANETGTACRGEEHDITLVWSITSGKRLILADGQEVHYSNNRNNLFEFSWTMRGNHVLKVLAHASPPINAVPGFRQYDFFVDGQSFFTFPKVYRLGLSQKDARHVATPTAPPQLADRSRPYNNYTVPAPKRSSTDIAAIEAPHNADEEDAYLKEAIKNSLEDQKKEEVKKEEVKKQEQAKPAEQSDLLIDFMSEPGPAPAPAGVGAAALPLPPSAVSPAPAYAAPVVSPASTVAYPGAPDTQPGPGPGPGFGMAPQPSIKDITSEFPAAAPPFAAPSPADPFAQAPAPNPGFAGAMQPAAAPVAPPAPAPAYQGSFVQQPSSVSGQTPFGAPAAPPNQAPFGGTTPSNPPAPPAQSDPALFSMSSLSGQPPAPAQGMSGTEADKAYESIANMADFNLSGSLKSNPFDVPASSAPAPSLEGLRAMGGVKQTTPKQEVMKAPAPGALVVSGTQQGNWGGGYGQVGAPPMGQPVGQGYGQAAPAGTQFGGYGAAPAATGYGAYGQQAPPPQQQFQAQPQYQQQPAQFYQQPPPPPPQQVYGGQQQFQQQY